jgi:hypothetical protein
LGGVGSESLVGVPLFEESLVVAQFLWPTLVGDSVICLDPADDGLRVGFLEFRAQVEGPLEMGVQTYHKHRQKKVVVVPCFGAVEVASVYEVLEWALGIREGERVF